VPEDSAGDLALFYSWVYHERNRKVYVAAFSVKTLCGN